MEQPVFAMAAVLSCDLPAIALLHEGVRQLHKVVPVKVALAQ